jgi:hypothetical protein
MNNNNICEAYPNPEKNKKIQTMVHRRAVELGKKNTIKIRCSQRLTIKKKIPVKPSLQEGYRNVQWKQVVSC